jgi:hypothetical protein
MVLTPLFSFPVLMVWFALSLGTFHFCTIILLLILASCAPLLWPLLLPWLLDLTIKNSTLRWRNSFHLLWCPLVLSNRSRLEGTLPVCSPFTCLLEYSPLLRRFAFPDLFARYHIPRSNNRCLGIHLLPHL